MDSLMKCPPKKSIISWYNIGFQFTTMARETIKQLLTNLFVKAIRKRSASTYLRLCVKNELKTIPRSAKRFRLSTYKTAPRQLLAAHKTPQEITNPVQEPPKTAEAALRCLSDFCDTASKAVSEASGLEGDMEPGSDQEPRGNSNLHILRLQTDY